MDKEIWGYFQTTFSETYFYQIYFGTAGVLKIKESN
jgi:hypothetical protein